MMYAPAISSDILVRVRRDYERFASGGLPQRLEEYLLDEYRLDVAAEYAGRPLKNPWGKASGQLSMTARQVEEDVAAGLGFVVLKTVIGQDETGEQSMSAWAIPESRMVAEPIVGQSGERGWTITWKGRGWWQSFDAYCQLIRDARQLAAGSQTLIVPSCKYHLPSPDEPKWRVSEYDYTTRRLLEAWGSGQSPPLAPPYEGGEKERHHEGGEKERHHEGGEKERYEGDKDSANGAAFSPPSEGGARGGEPVAATGSQTLSMPLEKDFSPTLAGSDRAAAQAKILEWLRVVPKLIRDAAAKSGLGVVTLGLKIFNALFDDEFQLEMLRAIHDADADRADFLIYANRLFDPNREFDGHKGVAYGGPDLSDRNLRVLDRWRVENKLPKSSKTSEVSRALPWSATGNITTGRMAVEYALRGATSFQLHTFCQLPADQYAMKIGNRTQRALHELYFHSATGFVVWMLDAAKRLGLSGDVVRFRDLAARA